MKHSIKYVLLGLLFFFIGSMSYAQITTSSLGGRIIDQKGEPVVGAAIIATHLPSGTTYAAVTNIDGRYTIQGMRPGGPYKVEISSLGYQSITYKDITLKLGELYDLNGKIKESSENLKESVVVATPKSKFAVEKTGASTNISSSQIQDIPTVNRSILDVAKLSPYGGNGMSFAGGDGRSTNFTVDGANFNNNFGLTPGLPGGGSPISLDAISEMQVVISPYDLRQSNFIGGGINAITKSGTNTLKGSLYTYYRNENMRGSRIGGVQLSNPDKEPNTTYGLTLGGPIIKNKLFFFANIEGTSSPMAINTWKPSIDGKSDDGKRISSTTISDMEKVSKYLKDTYGYDPGSITNFNKNNSGFKALLKIDWNISNSNHLAIRYNYTANKDWFLPSSTSTVAGSRLKQGRASLYSNIFSNLLYAKKYSVSSFSFDLNSRLSDNISNQLLATYSDINEIRISDSKPFPAIDIMSDAKASIPYMSLGYELYSWNNSVLNRVLSVKDDITYTIDNHKIMAGVNFEYQSVSNSFMRAGTGNYRFDSVDDFISGKAPSAVAITYGYNGNNYPKAKLSYNTISAYLQDEYNISSLFKLNYGIRFDTYVYNNSDLLLNKAIKDISFGGRHIDTGKWPTTNVQFSPRFGFIWDVLGNKTLKVRGGTGLFAGRLPLVFFTNMPTNSSMIQLTASNDISSNMNAFIKDGKLLVNSRDIVDAFNNIDPNSYPKNIDQSKGVRPYEVVGLESNFKMPQVWKSSIAVDYQLPTDFPLSVTGELIFNKSINASVMKNWAIKDNISEWEKTKDGAASRILYNKNSYYYSKAGKYGGFSGNPNAFVLSNTNKGYGWIASVSINTQPIKNLNITASYTHTIQYEITGMPGAQAGSIFRNLPTLNGPNYANLHLSQYVIPDRIIASISYRDKGNNQYSLFYQGYRHAGGSYVYTNDINGDSYNNDLIYIPKDANELQYKSKEDRDIFLNFVDRDPYLRSHKGEFAKAYSVYLPFVNSFDFRFSHDIQMNIANHMNILRLSVDCINIGNLINSNWGVSYKLDNSNWGARSLLMANVDPKTKKVVYSLNKKDNYKNIFSPVYSPTETWYVQLGIKYIF